MKRYSILLLMAGLFFVNAHAQTVSDSISMEAGYAEDVYYSMKNGEVATADNSNWDLAFALSGQGFSIRINTANGDELYVYPNGDTTAWNALDTTGLASWPQLYDSDTSWDISAFESKLDGSDPFDVGWGMYNQVSHFVKGDSIYVIKLSTGDWKKLWIVSLATGTYTFRYANLDGSNAQSGTLAKSDFDNKNFGYYSLTSNKKIDREPAKDSYDLVFTKYVTALAPGFYYGVTGVLANKGVTAAKAYPVNNPATYEDYNSETFSSEINAIGYDWKQFDNTTSKYTMEDSLVYFINDLNGNIWKMIFTGFGGSTDGKVIFEKELLSETGIAESKPVAALDIFPNPASEGYINIGHSFKNEKINVAIYDLSGKKVMSTMVNTLGTGNTIHINVVSLQSGAYIISLEGKDLLSSEKLFIR